ncbi:hypothetical protein Taro_027639 [Colocasia esculenta]|uniref:Serine-threonine/tyrosine-protein kinase catalytic domain-containing protein n=1 Tax=Colocasia esculenta TaxID=4460 RepID=A0A843VG90_COLES|nr:hypothetical protein [Colocasia esculenta]
MRSKGAPPGVRAHAQRQPRRPPLWTKRREGGGVTLVDHGHGPKTTVPAGTMRYLAPECATTGKASKESDVYSFGVVALKIACGRRPNEPAPQEELEGLVEWVWNLYGRHAVLEAADPRLGSGELDEMQLVATVEARLQLVVAAVEARLGRGRGGVWAWSRWRPGLVAVAVAVEAQLRQRSRRYGFRYGIGA